MPGVNDKQNHTEKTYASSYPSVDQQIKENNEERQRIKGSTAETPSSVNNLNSVDTAARSTTAVAQDHMDVIYMPSNDPTTTPPPAHVPVVKTTTTVKKSIFRTASADGIDNPLAEYTEPLDSYEHAFCFELPLWGVKEYINERTIWQKQICNFGSEQGWFYFKIFFNFKSAHGLLADLLDEDTKKEKTSLSKHSALYYLASIDNRYIQEQIPHRILALYKFGSTLRSIQTDTPWLFKGINGLDAVHSANLTDLGKDKSIEITLNTETLNQKIGTLMDTYKYACYDAINSKEIIPANLRKFDMSVLVYNVPVKRLQTAIYSNSEKLFDDKHTFLDNSHNFSDVMSFKLYTFENCEFDTTTLNTYVPNSLSNEQAFNLGGNNLKINYKRAYELRMNEFGQFMLGSTGFFYNNDIEQNSIVGIGNMNVCSYSSSTVEAGAFLKEVSNDKKYKINAVGNFDNKYSARLTRLNDPELKELGIERPMSTTENFITANTNNKMLSSPTVETQKTEYVKEDGTRVKINESYKEHINGNFKYVQNKLTSLSVGTDTNDTALDKPFYTEGDHSDVNYNYVLKKIAYLKNKNRIYIPI